MISFGFTTRRLTWLKFWFGCFELQFHSQEPRRHVVRLFNEIISNDRRKGHYRKWAEGWCLVLVGGGLVVRQWETRCGGCVSADLCSSCALSPRMENGMRRMHCVEEERMRLGRDDLGGRRDRVQVGISRLGGWDLRCVLRQYSIVCILCHVWQRNPRSRLRTSVSGAMFNDDKKWRRRWWRQSSSRESAEDGSS